MMQRRKVLLVGLLGLAAVLIGAPVFWIVTAPAAPFASDDPRFTPAGDVERGRRVFAGGDCASCHARPGEGDRLRLGGGMALASPFGTFRPPNISTDPVDGIGTWTAADLATALIRGVSPAGRHYYPAFPYTSYTGMTFEDIRDLYAYLRTLPAIAGKAPPHDLPLLFRIRRMLGAWKFLYFRERQTAAVFNGDALHDRGAYLVSSVAHCAECHSSRNIFGAIREKTRFAGGVDPEGTGFIPNITPERIGHWSQDEIAGMLRTGETPDHGRVGSSMADVVVNTAMLTEEDRCAIAAYIASLPARPTPSP